MKIPLFSKIFGGCLLIIALLSILIPLLSFNLIKTHYVNTFTDNLKNLAIALKPDVTSLLEKQRFQELDAYVKTLKNQIHSRITVIDGEGKVLADSEKDPKTMENHKIRPEVLDALSGDVGKSLRFSVTVEEDMLYVALPIEKDGRVSGVIRISTLLKQINSLLNELKMHILWIALIMTILSLGIAFMLSRGVSRPVKTLVQAIKRLSTGNFDTKVFLKNEDELKELGNCINEMAAKMHDVFDEISARTDELRTIISSIQESLVVLDKDGRIRLSNDSFGRLIKQENVEGKFYWEVVRSPEFAEMMKKVGADGGIYYSGEVHLYDKVFLCSTNYLVSKDETIVLLHDITDFKNLERTKKEFIANISHELRTPLTAIKGFVETLEDEEDIKNKRYLEIIKRHTDRLMHIVGDLLLLSENEEKGAELELEEVSLENIIENVLKIFENRAKEKNININVTIQDTLPFIQADPFKLEQMFINLIDNAIKYTEEGEITISITENNGLIVINVRDTGIGISNEYLPRIFERFYVVDKSRSKRLGGTGLGLSIVKHIVMLHKGAIDVESTPGKGTQFTITLPINPE
ncbi:MAG: ATP-binding protein [Proteobacteria bacterium]|nr:ATP-binding protein [Pseudomonadota bacterium]